MPYDCHEGGARKSALQEAGHQNVGGRLFEQIALGEIPVWKPVERQLRVVVRGQQVGILGEVRTGRKGETAGSPVNDSRRIDGLQELAFIFEREPFRGYLIVRKAAHLGLLSKHPEEQSGATPMQPATKHEMVRLGDSPRLIETKRASRFQRLPLHAT